MSRSPVDPATGRRRPGRRPGLDRTAIAEAALAGLGDLTIAKVAARLGVAPSVLYTYVAGRRELIALAADHSLQGRTISGSGPDWRRTLQGFADLLLDVLEANPGLPGALRELVVPPPRFAALLEHVGRELASAGVDADTASTAAVLLSHVAMDEAQAGEHRSTPPTAEEDVARRATFRGRCGLIVDGVAFRLPK